MLGHILSIFVTMKKVGIWRNDGAWNETFPAASCLNQKLYLKLASNRSEGHRLRRCLRFESMILSRWNPTTRFGISSRCSFDPPAVIISKRLISHTHTHVSRSVRADIANPENTRNGKECKERDDAGEDTDPITHLGSSSSSSTLLLPLRPVRCASLSWENTRPMLAFARAKTVTVFRFTLKVYVQSVSSKTSIFPW